MTGTLIYNKWKGMKQRCYNSNYDFTAHMAVEV